MVDVLVAGFPRLLSGDDPTVWSILREDGQSPFILACDHAGNRLPKSLGDLGLPAGERQRHIAWDIGVAGLARIMADALDAFTILQTYSRLVIDCNRPPEAKDSIAILSELTAIPGNQALSPAARQMRLDEIFTPYHTALRRELDRRQKNKVPAVLIALHSFTPVFKGNSRPWHAGLLYNRDNRMAKAMIEQLEREGGLVIGDNQPYALGDDSDYTVPVHGERRGIPHVEVEVRQDLIADEAGQRLWAERLGRILTSSWKAIVEG